MSNRCYFFEVAWQWFSDHKNRNLNFNVVLLIWKLFLLFCYTSFDINPLRRHTFWTIVIGATFSWIAVSGTNQTMVQRIISCKSITHARVWVTFCSFYLAFNQIFLWNSTFQEGLVGVSGVCFFDNKLCTNLHFYTWLLPKLQISKSAGSGFSE